MQGFGALLDACSRWDDAGGLITSWLALQARLFPCKGAPVSLSIPLTPFALSPSCRSWCAM